jgi:multicomponent Na+:H+ antiporter subunit E
MRRSLLVIAGSTVVWLVLWRDLSWANLLSGLLLSVGALGLFPFARPPRRLRVNPVALVRFVVISAWAIVRANVVVAWEVVTPKNRVNEGVVAVPLRTDAPVVITMVSHAIGLAPGTMVVDIEHGPTVLHVHVLHLRSVEEIRESVLQLEELALAAVIGRDET